MKTSTSIHNTDSPLSRKEIIERVSTTKEQGLHPALRVERWTPNDESLTISWTIATTMLGEVLIATTAKGICFIGFTGGATMATLQDMQRRFPGSRFIEASTSFSSEAIAQLDNPADPKSLTLHLKGSDFQQSVWKKILRIPFGGLTTYTKLGNAKQARAIGSAVGANPISYIVACHRVVHTDGNIQGYYWGNDLKRKLLSFEATVSSSKN